jgi:hypothetical protein
MSQLLFKVINLLLLSINHIKWTLYSIFISSLSRRLELAELLLGLFSQNIAFTPFFLINWNFTLNINYFGEI